MQTDAQSMPRLAARLLVLVGAAALANGAGAADLYWFTNAATLGGTGNWSAAGTNWSASTTTPSVTLTTWDPTQTANFRGTAGTVTLADANVNAGAGLTFDVGAYVLTANTLTLTGAAPVTNSLTVGGAFTATINSVVAGTAGFFKVGPGTLVLGAANTYTGQTVVKAGVVNLTGTINTADSVWVGSDVPGATLQITGAAASATNTDGDIGVASAATGNVATVSGGAAWHNTVNLIVGVDGGANALSILAGSTATAQNGYVGENAGSAGNTALVSGAGASWTTAGNLLVGFAGSTNSLTVSGGGTVSNLVGGVGWEATAGGNAVRVTGAGSKWTTTDVLYIGNKGGGNTFTVDTGATAGSTHDTAVGFDVGANGNSLIVKDPGSRFDVSATNTLIIGDKGNGNTLDISNHGLVTGKNARLAYHGGSGNAVTVSGSGSAWTHSGTIHVGSVGSGNSVLVTAGAAASFSGNAFIGNGAAAANNSVTVTGAGSTWQNGGTLAVGLGGPGNALTVSAGGSVTSPTIGIAVNPGSGGTVNVGAGGAAGTLVGPITFGAGAGTLNFNHTDAAYTFSNGVAGPGGVNFIGSGTTLFGGTNSYSGGTTLSAGTLRLAADSALPATGTLVFNGGTLAANDHAASAGVLLLLANSTLAFGTPASRQDVAFASAAPWAGGTLTINGWDGPTGSTYDRLVIAADPTGSGVLAHIQFSGYAPGATWIAASGEVVPNGPPLVARNVPALSPAGVALLLVLLAGAGALCSRRIRGVAGR